ncbi:MAG: prenyltransferase/squalene oxidase repeat-containing protein, partial [Planctomycetota bacterium]
CVWKPTRSFDRKVIGATALAVVALRASGVPREDPVLQKAVHQTLLFGSRSGAYSLRPEMDGYVYSLSLVAMALSRMDPKRYRVQIQACASALARGQLPNGRWTYYVSGTDRRPGDPNGDNSNTQYAILGLRAARRASARIPPETWQRAVDLWRSTQNVMGGWFYKDRSWRRHLSMTSAGVGSLAICLEGLHGGAKASEIIATDPAMRRGLVSLGYLLLRRKAKGYGNEELYVYYGVERAGVLTQVRAFEDFDWYAEGVKRLLASQADDGSWGTPGARGIAKGNGYGPAVDTCYALLFLKRATATVGPPRDQQVVRVPLTRGEVR